MHPVQLHPADGTQLDGYRVCTCGANVLDFVFSMTGGMCWTCFVDGKTRHLIVREVIHQGRRTNIPKLGSRPRNHGRNANQGIRKAAKAAAAMRVARIYPELFEMFYAEERVRRGLAPVPPRTREPVAAQGAETVDFAPVYAALSNRGDAPDGVPEPQART